jgi:hypothetical protein
VALSKADAEAVAFCPQGWRFTIVFLSRLKYDLVRHPMTARERLELLEGIDGLLNEKLTAEVVAAIEPADDATAEIVDTAVAAGFSAASDLLSKDDVFRRLIALNPRWLRAIQLMQQQYYGFTTPTEN